MNAWHACPAPRVSAGLGHAPGRTAGRMTAMWQAFDPPSIPVPGSGGPGRPGRGRLADAADPSAAAHDGASGKRIARSQPSRGRRSRRARRSMACAHRSRIVRNARRRSGAGTSLPLAGWLLLMRARLRRGHRLALSRDRTADRRIVRRLRLALRPHAHRVVRHGPVGLVALAWIDLESTLLPDAITLPLAWAGLLVNLGDGFARRRWRCWARWRATASCG